MFWGTGERLEGAGRSPKNPSEERG